MAGIKTHTIRTKRRNRPRPGQTFYGFCGLRTTQVERLFDSPIIKVDDIVICDSGQVYENWAKIVKGQRQPVPYPQIEIDGTRLADDEMEALAKRDGFASLFAMSQFWDLSQPLRGDIVYWKPFVVNVSSHP